MSPSYSHDHLDQFGVPFRIIRGPGQEHFFTVSYSKPALGEKYNQNESSEATSLFCSLDPTKGSIARR